MNIDDLLIERQRLIDKRDSINQMISTIESEIAEKSCPYSIGEDVISRDEKMQITKIKFTSYKPHFRIKAKKHKKGGGLYVHEHIVWGGVYRV